MSRLVAIVCLVTLVAPAALAQTTGAISGRVTDEAGSPLPGVTVTVSSISLQGLKVTASNESGDFRLPLLPPGEYTARFTLPGYSPIAQPAVTVSLGRTTSLYVEMVRALEEEVWVTGAAPTIDISSTEVGINMTDKFFLSLPIERRYTSVLRVAPGTADDGAGTMVYGSSGAENAYYIDGLNVTGICYGTASKEFNFEFVEEVQVKSGGYQAEFGRSTGGLINVITKSGGNEFHGDGFGYYYDDNLQSSRTEQIADYRREHVGSYFSAAFTESDLGADLGGYLLRDTLWFFAAYNRVNHDVDRQVAKDFTPYGGPPEGKVYVNRTTRNLWSAKLTWRIGLNHSMVASSFGDPTGEEGPFRGLNGEEWTFLGTVDTGGNDGMVRWDGVFTDTVVVSAQTSLHGDRRVISGPGADISMVVDCSTALTAQTGDCTRSGGLGSWADQRYTRDLYRADLTYYASGFAGDHEIKAGAEVEDLQAEYTRYRSGGQRLWIECARGHLTENGCDPEWTYYHHTLLLTEVPPGGLFDPNFADYIIDAYTVDSRTVNTAAYLRDSWRVLPKLTLNLGLRWERQRIWDNQGNVRIVIDDQWAPRLGFVWDFRGNGGSKLYGSWGRFFETVPMDINVRAFNPYASAWIVNQDPASLVCDPSLHERDPRAFPRCEVWSVSLEPVDPTLKGQYVEEAILGAELEVVPGLAVGAKLLWRDLGRVVEDSLTPDFSYYIGNPGSGKLTEALDLWYLRSYPVDTPERTFTGAELTARKRFSDNWQMIASYLWSKLEGSYDGSYQASTGQLDPNLNSAFDYAEFQVNNHGYLTNDRRHQLKLDLTYQFSFGLNAGVSAYYRTGTPVTAMGYAYYYGNWEFYLSRRGEWDRTASEYEASVHLGYPITVRGVQVNLLFDVFNLLDRQGETGRDMRYNLDQIHDVIDYDTGEILPPIPNGTPCTETVPADYALYCNSGFNAADAWQDPRSVRLGVRVTF